MKELYASLYSKYEFSCISKNALDVVENAKHVANMYKELQTILDKCDSYSWEGNDGCWIHIYANTNDVKLRTRLINDFNFEASEVE